LAAKKRITVAFTPSAPSGEGRAEERAVGVVNRVRTRLPEMSGALVKIAEFILEHPNAALDASIGELAQLTGTSPATITRFCRQIGYQGYASFRVSIATELGRVSARETWKTDIGRAFGPDDSPDEVLSTLMNAHMRSLQETASMMDLKLLKRIAGRIASSTHVDIYGVGGSAMLAAELHARLYRIGINSHHWSEVHVGLTSAAIQDEACVAIGISNTGRTEETIQMLRQARLSGALTVALSNNPSSPLAEAADLQIITSVHEHFLQPDDLSAKHVQLLVLDLLYLLVAQHNFERTTTNLSSSAQAVAAHRRPQSKNRRPAPAVPPKEDQN
jgi:DNA-binding MurR/RpiR family transcriptional regulator